MVEREEGTGAMGESQVEITALEFWREEDRERQSETQRDKKRQDKETETESERHTQVDE